MCLRAPTCCHTHGHPWVNISNSKHLLNAYYIPGTILSTRLTHDHSFNPHCFEGGTIIICFTDEETRGVSYTLKVTRLESCRGKTGTQAVWVHSLAFNHYFILSSSPTIRHSPSRCSGMTTATDHWYLHSSASFLSPPAHECLHTHTTQDHCINDQH